VSSLRVLPCLDSKEMATARKRAQKIPRQLAAAMGRSAVQAAASGRYLREDGREVVWHDAVQTACAAKISIAPESELPRRDGVYFPETRVQVTNETTLGAARRLADHGAQPLALNFANGVQPGGGFLLGAGAQEEVLCRSSALYATLVNDPMYEAHWQRPRPDSTDWAILSPCVPVFRMDDGTTLERPWLLDFVTCAAPYAPVIGQPESGELLQRRIHRVLAIAQAYGYVTLVLGAWGCGAFGNDPVRTAADFRSALENQFGGAFGEVVFAVADSSSARITLVSFRDAFSDAPLSGA